ncbi:MAG: hypothetical protein AAF902_19485 [Chloroflexota bacterium]
MHPLYQLLLFILAVILIGVIGSTIYNVINFFSLRRRMRDVDSKVWALESGADKVTLNRRDNWLEIVLNDQNIGMGILRRPKNVIIENHEQYKAYVFDYPRRFSVGKPDVKGIVMQLYTGYVPDFILFQDENWAQRWQDSQQKISMNHTLREFESSHTLLLSSNKTNAESRKEVDQFFQKHSALNDMIRLPNFAALFGRQHFLALYLKIEDEEMDTGKILFGFDEALMQILINVDISEN